MKVCCVTNAMLSFCVPLLAILITKEVGAQSQMGFDTTENMMAMEAQRRLIVASMRRQANETAGFPLDSSVPIEAALEVHPDQEAVPSFAGTAIPASTDSITAGRGRDKQSTDFPVMSTDQLEHLSDPELFQIFHKGTAEIPSDLPGQRGKFTACKGRTLLNVFSNQGWPNGTMPTGDFNFWNNYIDRGWRGKVMRTDPETNKTELWNLFLNNSTVDVIANVSIWKGGISEDKKDSMVVNYNQTNAVFFRTIDDELRRVGPHIWLGRAWVVNPIEAWQPFAADPTLKPLVDTAFQVENATWMAALAGTMLEGPLSSPTTSGGVYPNLGQPLALLYFTLDCADYPVPKLHYTPVLAPASAFVNSITGYDVPFYSLPDLEKYNNTGDPGAIDNLNASWPITTQQQSQPYVLWPYTFDDPNGALDGYLELPASWFEPLFGAYWAISNQTAPAINAAGTIGNALHMQNIDNYFPGLPKAVATNPLTPLRNTTEILQNAARKALSPVTSPINEAISDINRTLISPQSENIKKQSEIIGSAFAPAVRNGLALVPNIDSLVGRNAPLPSAARGVANTAITAIDESPATAAVLQAANNAASTAQTASAAAVTPDNATPALTNTIHTVGRAIYGDSHVP
eukprot:jgi/Botrbrau1/19502/Bobra.0035s0004.1